MGNTDVCVFVYLRVIRDVQAHVLTIADVAVFDGRTRPLAAHTHSGAHCKQRESTDHTPLNSTGIERVCVCVCVQAERMMQGGGGGVYLCRWSG